MRDEEITVSSRHLKLRVAAFILVLIVAVSAFSIAITSLGRKEEGYNAVETTPDEEAVRYGNNVAFRYYFTGSSNEIKQAMNVLKEDYSAVLKRAYKLLDPTEEYTGFTNLATLNRNPGQELTVSDELFEILLDAMDRTREQQGFNMFAGALYSEWESILVLSEPEEFDPLNHPDIAARLKAIAEMTADLSHFELEIVDREKRVVRFCVSEEYRQFLQEYEIEAPILDLNQLRDAYELQLVTAVLEERGYTNGYLSTTSGLTASLSGHENGEYCVYACADGQLRYVGGFPVRAGSACSQLKAFAFAEGEACYYTLQQDDAVYYRHPNFSLDSGDFANLLASSYVVSDAGEVVEACYRNLQLYSARTIEELQLLASNEQNPVAYTLLEADGQICVNAAGQHRLEIDAESSYTMIPLS